MMKQGTETKCVERLTATKMLKRKKQDN